MATPVLLEARAGPRAHWPDETVTHSLTHLLTPYMHCIAASETCLCLCTKGASKASSLLGMYASDAYLHTPYNVCFNFGPVQGGWALHN